MQVAWPADTTRAGPEMIAQALAQTMGEVRASSSDCPTVAARTRSLLNDALERLDEETRRCGCGRLHRETIASLFRHDVPRQMLLCMEALDFENRKVAMRLLDAVVRRALTPPCDAAELVESYMREHPDTLQHLLAGCGKLEVFFLCSPLIKSFARSPSMAKALLDAGAANHLLDLAFHQNFDIASEAFVALRELLLAHADISAEYVQDHASSFFPAWHLLLSSEDNYVIKRQALRFLAEMLLDASFQDVMCEYVRTEQYLRIHMNLLIDDSVTIQLEAFHVFKLFVANPYKPARLQLILAKNRHGLVKKVKYLSGVQRDDAQFESDAAHVIGALTSLEG